MTLREVQNEIICKIDPIFLSSSCVAEEENLNKISQILNDNLWTVDFCDHCYKFVGPEQEINIFNHNDVCSKSNKSILVCWKCPFSTNILHDLRLHVRTNHLPKQPSTCSICGATFKTNYNYFVHMRRHTGFKPYQCRTCNTSYASMRVLQHHELTHSKMLKFPCIQCGKYFTKLEYLLKHLHRHFNTNKPFCKLCGQTAAHNQVLQRHMPLHYVENEYPCSRCNASFRSPRQLSCHNVRAHGKQKQRFMCHRCGVINLKRRHHVYHKKYECGYTRTMPPELRRQFKYDTVYMDSHS